MKLLYIFSISLLFLISVQAQTTGPAQPEVQGFMPVNATDMVDLYSGDLNYNIPLMTIPGPEGMSYPLNIFYNSNVSMEMMPSMVGLGWNLNTGAIVRNLRGLPDDFRGDEVEQTSYVKPSWTLSFDMPKKILEKEVVGLDFQKGIKPKVSLYYNNYSGMGLDLGLNLKANLTDDSKNETNSSASALFGNLKLGFDNQEGFSLSPSVSYEKISNDKNDLFDRGIHNTAKIGTKLNSKQGLKDVTYGFSQRNLYKLSMYGKVYDAIDKIFGGAGIKQKLSSGFSHSYASASPSLPLKQTRFSSTANFGLTLGEKYDLIKDPKVKGINITGSYTRSWVTGVTEKSEAYGAMYMRNWQSRKEDKDVLTDFYRENDGLMHKKRMVTPIPILTNDLFTVQGHGIGGTFRIHQGAIGRMNEAKMKSRVTSAKLTFEAGTGSSFKVGSDIGGSYGESYSGHWKNPDKYMQALDFKFKSRSGLYEPFYFKMIGEPTFMEQGEWDLYEQDTPIAFDIQAIWTKTKAYSRYNRSDNYFHKRANDKRIKRVTHIEYFKQRELENLYATPPNHIVDGNSHSAIDYDKGESHHVQGYSMLKSNGIRYNYFLPAYNKETTRETFAIPGKETDTLSFQGTKVRREIAKVIDAIDMSPPIGGIPITVTLKGNFDQVNNNTGGDEYYNKEVIPAYVHSYFLTSILSHDYVDINNNGPDESDLGTYIKFNYIERPDYKWRFPFEGYYYSRGNISNEKDDKASAQWGTKDLYYIKSIETKTHLAVFEYIDMKMKDSDGVALNKQLKSIKLYSKSANDYATGFYYNNSASPTPIQTTTFTQDYSLKPNTPNSLASTEGDGVLTLKELQFTYQDNTKGELTPYRFEYGENRPYDASVQDVWGAYQPEQIQTDLYNNENPFTYQYDDYSDRAKDASAWLLNKVTLPSKGEIHVDYEKDDYSYVQNKKAMSFLKLVGTGDQVYTDEDDIGTEIKKDFEYLYFRTPTTTTTDMDVKPYLEGIKYLKFRLYLKLKPNDNFSRIHRDYVEGYAEIDPNVYGRINASTAYVKVKPLRHKTNWYNPMRLAAFQYLRKARPDLGPNYKDPASFGMNYIPEMLTELSSLVGYYGTARIKNYAPSLSEDKPSFIRLNTPYKKYGGGSRVKEITLVSNDINEYVSKDSIYGQEYRYLAEDGITSSGVAEFEPLVNLSENPFTQPIFYGMKKKILFSEGGYLPEEPLGAGLYPSPKVGYSRVSVRNKEYETDTDTVALAQSGINVSEFYTAKDFPTQADRSGALFAPMNIPTVPIPFVGSITFQHNGYSQGYAFHKFEGVYGQAKSVATYPYAEEEPTTPPIQKSVYHYKTKSTDKKSLSDLSTVLHKEGVKEKLYLNKNVDFYIDEIEASSFHTSLGGQFNLSWTPPFIFLPTLFPAFSYLNKSTRYLTTNKIIYTYPVLEKVEQFKDGAKVTTSNLAYDGETGEAIITSVTNEWERPVYTYNFPAHWTYEQMKGAYKNYKAKVEVISAPSPPAPNNKFKLSGLPSSQIPMDLLQEGDVLSDGSDKFYVSNLDRSNNLFDLKSRDTTIASAGDYSVFKSGYRNLQSLKKGHIVSLEDHSAVRPFASLISTSREQLVRLFMGKFNENQTTFPSTKFSSTFEDSGTMGNLDLDYCDIEEIILGWDYNGVDTNEVRISYSDLQGNPSECYFSANTGRYFYLDISKFRFLPQTLNTLSNPWEVQMEYTEAGHPAQGQTFTFTVELNTSCISCQIPEVSPIPVLQASAIEYKDDFKLYYKHLKDESTDLTANLTQIRDNGSGNPWAFGIRGIWRPWRTSSYLEKRKQTQPNLYGKQVRLDRDGEFDFYWFDWKMPILYNEDYNWRWVNEVTQYNPNGLSQEGKNRLDIYSASLFGYNNHLVTASASNSKTTDIVFDGFEDYELNAFNNYTGRGHGNLNFKRNNSGSDIYPMYPEGHTGNYSFNLAEGASCATCYYYYKSSLSSVDFFKPELEKKYYMSFWTKSASRDNSNSNNIIPQAKIEVLANGNVLKTFQVSSHSEPIDGWYKVDGFFELPSTANDFELRMYMVEDTDVLLDDIRIQPFHSGMETYVYDPENYRLRATLNNQNFATFYTYDEEGSLVSTKVETEEGIKTISTNRNNIHQD